MASGNSPVAYYGSADAQGRQAADALNQDIANKLRLQQATVGGQAQGNAATAYINSLKQLGLPLLGGGGGFSSSMNMGGYGGGATPPAIQSPSMQGLSSAAGGGMAAPQTLAPVDTSAAESAA